MNKKQFLILLGAVVILGAGAWLGSKDKTTSAAGTPVAGGKLIADFPLNDIDTIHLQNSEGEVNIEKKDGKWIVRERAGYPASYPSVSDLIKRIWETKTVQFVKVGESQLERLQLTPPVKQTPNTGTLLQLTAGKEKTYTILLGKKHQRQVEPDFPFGGGDDGRYIKYQNNVWLLADPFNDGVPKPEYWIDKDLIAAEKLKSITVTPHKDSKQTGWTLLKKDKDSAWELQDAKKDRQLDNGKIGSLDSAFHRFEDVLPADTKLENPTVVTIETFDGFHYQITFGTPKDGFSPLTVSVDAQLVKERTPDASEKPEDKQRLDTEFQDNLKQLEERLAREKQLEGRIFKVVEGSITPFLQNRDDLYAAPPAEPAPAAEEAPAQPTAKKSTPAKKPTPAKKASAKKK